MNCGIRFFREPSFERKSQIGRSGVVIDEEFAVRVGEFRSGDGERRSEGFQQGLEGRIGLPALGDGLVEIAEDAERELRSEVALKNWAEEMEVGKMIFPQLAVLPSVRDMGRMPGDADTDKADAVRHPGNKAPAGKIRMADEIRFGPWLAAPEGDLAPVRGSRIAGVAFRQ